jgi:hypothetical protein
MILSVNDGLFKTIKVFNFASDTVDNVEASQVRSIGQRVSPWPVR